MLNLQKKYQGFSLRLLFVVFFFQCSPALFAQNGARINQQTLTYYITKEAGKLSIRSVEVIDKEVLSIKEANDYELKEMVHVDKFCTLGKVENYTLSPEIKGKRKKTKAKSVSMEDAVSRGIFYSDDKRVIFTFPAVENGAILHSEVELLFSKPQLIDPFYFDGYLENKNSVVIFRVDQSVEMKFSEYFYGYQGEIEKTEWVEGKTHVYKWEAKNMTPRIYESKSDGVSCYSPHLIPRVASYKEGGETINVLRHKEDLFGWYSSLIKDEELDPEYQPVLDSLKSVSSGEVELAENIFNWVQHWIKYIAYEDGMGGFVPRSPNEVMSNRYGDCKDMAQLTCTMMNSCGLKSYITWIGTREKCYTYEECPTPLVDNHVIVAYMRDGELIFMDPTSTYSEFGTPSSFTQGKEAMVRLSKDEFEIHRVPFLSSEYSKDIGVYDVQIDGERIHGQGENIRTGYEKQDYEYGLAYSELSKEELFRTSKKVGNKSFIVSNLVQSNYNSNKGDLKSSFDFEVKNYVSTYENSLYICPFIDKVIDLDLGKRKLAMQIEHQYENKANVTIHVPEKMKVKELPETFHLVENGLELAGTLSVNENLVNVEYSFTNNLERVSAADFEKVKLTVKKMQKMLKQQIELEYEK